MSVPAAANAVRLWKATDLVQALSPVPQRARRALRRPAVRHSNTVITIWNGPDSIKPGGAVLRPFCVRAIPNQVLPERAVLKSEAGRRAVRAVEMQSYSHTRHLDVSFIGMYLRWQEMAAG